MDGPRRPVPWAVAVVYGAVFAGGVYWSLIGEGHVRLGDLAGFVLVFALLFALELVDWRRPQAMVQAAALAGARPAASAPAPATVQVAALAGASPAASAPTALAGARPAASTPAPVTTGVRLAASAPAPATASSTEPRAARIMAVALLAARVGLFAAAALLDGSGTSRALFVLVPFVAYFAFGRATSAALAAACLALVVAGFTVSTPDWPRHAEYVSDLLMFTIGLVLAVCMAAVATAERDARSRLESTLDRVAELSATMERNRVARDIHDGLGHHLTAIAIQLEKATAFADRDPALAARAVEDARGSAREALADVRRSVHALRDEMAPFSLRAALADLARDGGEPAVTVSVTGEPERYEAAALTALYRAAQEGLTNARRHAGASAVTVSAVFEEAGARLVVADDGRGFATPGEGFGLIGMRERVELVGGEVTVDSGPGAGTVVTVTIPHEHARSAA